jgi:hypothetical protein
VRTHAQVLIHIQHSRGGSVKAHAAVDVTRVARSADVSSHQRDSTVPDPVLVPCNTSVPTRTGWGSLARFRGVFSDKTCSAAPVRL